VADTNTSSRGLAAVELAGGGAIVIAHNVLRLLPNEVPILVAIALLSMRLRRGCWDWAYLGFRRPGSWGRIVAIALLAAAVRIVGGDWLIEPATQHFWPPARAPAAAHEITGHIKLLLLYLPVVWGFAAFGEEVAYRGYLLNRGAESGGGTKTAWWAAVLVSAVLFGFGHYYKGPAGVTDSAFAGLVLGAAYVLSGRNLWTSVLAHGFIDTFALIAAYLGWDG
jgi:membrane protease YdiL (CAAX protease family)